MDVSGDLLVYDLAWSPWRLIRVVHNTAQGHDPVVDITWSLDGTMLAATNQMVGEIMMHQFWMEQHWLQPVRLYIR